MHVSMCVSPTLGGDRPPRTGERERERDRPPRLRGEGERLRGGERLGGLRRRGGDLPPRTGLRDRLHAIGTHIRTHTHTYP